MEMRVITDKIIRLLNTQNAQARHAYYHARSAFRHDRRFEPKEATKKSIRALFPDMELEEFERLVQVMKDEGIITKEEAGSLYFNLPINWRSYDRYE